MNPLDLLSSILFLIVIAGFAVYLVLLAIHAVIWKLLIHWDKQDKRRACLTLGGGVIEQDGVYVKCKITKPRL